MLERGEAAPLFCLVLLSMPTPTPTPPPPPTAKPRNGRMRRGIYLLPSAFTIGNMLFGFYAVVSATRGEFQKGALLIFAAAILDALDGRIARMSGTDSDFGKEYDSLADVLTFGSAPALMAYFWGLDELSFWGLQSVARIGWLIPLYFLVCCATRLARFNVQTKVIDSRYFVGLPAPAAAGAICSILFFVPDQEWRPWTTAFMALALLVVGSLMVSTFRYKSFKEIDLRRRWSYRAMLLIAAVILVAVARPDAFFLVVATIYTVSGPLAWVWGRVRPRRSAELPEEAPLEESPEETV